MIDKVERFWTEHPTLHLSDHIAKT